MSKDSRTDDKKAVFHVDPAMEGGVYANAANILHSPNEFILDFIMALPGDRRKVVSRLITSPAHAKQLVEALARNVEKYEAAYGVIEAAKMGPEFEGPVN